MELTKDKCRKEEDECEGEAFEEFCGCEVEVEVDE